MRLLNGVQFINGVGLRHPQQNANQSGNVLNFLKNMQGFDSSKLAVAVNG